MVLQRDWGAEHRHDAIACELAQRPAAALHHGRGTVQQFGHDFAQPLRTHCCCDVHRMNNIGEQHRHLLVLSRSADLCDRYTALVTELGVQWQLRATRPTRQSRCSHFTATVAHANIVSPLVNDVRHIAAPSPTRSFETLICRLFRDDGAADWSSYVLRSTARVGQPARRALGLPCRPVRPVHKVLVGTGTQRVHADFAVYLDEFVKARVHVGAQRGRQVVVQQLLVHLRELILASDLESGIVPLSECRRLFQTSLM